MVADLSNIIQDGLCGTLKDLLAKDAILKETTKIDNRDINGFELIRIDSEFAFEKLNTIFSFFIPANSASIIFNTMMGSAEYDILDNIDDDTADAMGEFISNISGGLVTSMNAEELDNLGQVKFNIPHKDILNGSDITEKENIFRFLIGLEGQEVSIFIGFKEDFLPNIENITKSEITFYPEEPKKEEKKEEPKKEEKKEEPKKEESTPSEELKEESVDPKSKKIKLIIMILGGLIILVILLIIIMYFMKEPEPEPKMEEMNTTKKTEDKVSVIKYTTLKKVDFKISDIDVKRLNTRLEKLTKYEILNQEELEAQALEDKNRLYTLTKERELLEFAKKNKEEPLMEKTKDKRNMDNSNKKDSNSLKNNMNQEDSITDKLEPPTNMNSVTTKEQKTIQIVNDPIKKDNDNKLKFLLASSFKYALFRDLVNQTNSIEARISICNDENGRTSIYIGPFENSKLQMKMESLIKENNKDIKTKSINITKEEFDKRCNF